MIRNPVIILGMHRSGTGMLTSILENLGLFIGHSKEHNNESIFFLQINEWLLQQANASWDNPYCFSFINDELNQQLSKAMNSLLMRDNRVGFLGPDKLSKYCSIKSLDIPWGWKDPRNTFTIDIWKNLFPDAKILHIYRNPIDVATSLQHREQKRNLNIKQLINGKDMAELLRNNIKFQLSPRVLNLEEGIKLWREYVNKALSLSETTDLKCMHIKYEDFIEHPDDILNKILDFINLSADEESIAKCISSIDSSRGFAFKNNTSKNQAYSSLKNEPLVKTLNYDSIL